MKWMKLPSLTWVLVMLAPTVLAVEWLDPAEVAPGTTGICITEMDGGERLEVPLTVLGTVGWGTPRGEKIIVRLEHPRFDETGIIAGMSGSPVYVDGKLLGALAYGFPFASEPIGGVTPFARMVEVEPSPPPAGLAPRPQLAELLAAARDGDLGQLVVDWLVPGGPAESRPLPVAVAGWNPAPEAEWLTEVGRRMGWVSVAGGATPHAPADSEVTAGSMVAAVMVDGDVTLAAGGTVTEVRDDRLWAFGHSSLGAGTISMPLARAGVVAVVPSLMNSFKLFTVGEPIGAIVADRRDGILAHLGGEASMVPISLTVNAAEYSYRAVRHPILLPLLTGYLAQTSLGVDGRIFGDQTVAVEVTVRYPGERTARIAATVANAQAAAEASAYAAAVIAYLEGSAFEVPEVESISLSFETVERLETATIVDIVPERRVVRPGDDLAVHFRLRPYRGTDRTVTLQVHVPEGTPEGRVDLVGADGAAWTAYDLQMRPLRPASFDDEIRLVNSVDGATSLVAVLERREAGVVVPGGTVSAPPSVVIQMQTALGPNLDTVAYNVSAKTVATVPFPVSGAQRIPVTVRADARESETR